MALTMKQKKYCQERAKGKGYADAYESAGYCPNTSRRDKKINAYHMENASDHSEEIKAKIKELTDLADEKAILGRVQKQALLTKIALNDNNDMPDRLRALDQLNRMSGEYTDTVRTQVSGKIDMTFEEKLAAIQADMENETA